MNDQPSLFESFPPYQKHSTTSFDAACEISGRSGTLRRAVFETLYSSVGGMTDDELQVRLNMNPSTQRPRRIELVEKGLTQAEIAKTLGVSTRTVIRLLAVA